MMRRIPKLLWLALAFSGAALMLCSPQSAISTARAEDTTADEAAPPAKKPDALRRRGPLASKAAADKKANQAQPALDEALLKDLDNELLDGAGDLQRPPSKPARPEDAAADEAQPIDGEDIGMPSEDADPLARISQEMRRAESLIPKSGASAPTQKLHEQIAKDLDKLIEQAAKQSAKQGSAEQKKSQKSNKRQLVQQPGSPKPGKQSNKPAQDSTDRLGKAEDAKPDPEAMKSLLKDAWGHLPPHAREQMLQNSPERFLPQYEVMIERYYKRLAEEGNSK